LVVRKRRQRKRSGGLMRPFRLKSPINLLSGDSKNGSVQKGKTGARRGKF